MKWRHRLQGLFWQNSPWIRGPLRSLRLRLSLLRHRLRAFQDPQKTSPRVIHRPSGRTTPFPNPPIVSTGKPDLEKDPTRLTCSLDSPEASNTLFCWTPSEDSTSWPATHLEMLTMTVAAEDLPMVIAGWAPPSPSTQPLAESLQPADISAKLFRLPDASASLESHPGIVARAVSHVTGRPLKRFTPEAPSTRSVLTQTSGPYWLASDLPGRRVLRTNVHPIDQRLSRLPTIQGPPTVLFLLPFLAIGGAERLLFDLLRSWGDRFRALVVTLEPHQTTFGQTVDTCRELTPWLFNLGDALPREAQFSALAHLIRRFEVQTLFSWNGTVAFYDFAPALARRFPELRIIDQLYNHHGGWIEHYSPRLRRSIDLHVAVNSRIAEALEMERGVDAQNIVTIHHGVEIPDLPRPAEQENRKQRARKALGLSGDPAIVGTFIRLHQQKRPLDILALARRFAEKDVHFLLAGGGPMDTEVDRELAQRPIPNLTRLPLQSDVEPLYEAIDLALMTSDYEGLPIFLLDALARGIPAVATSVGDIPLLFAQGGGLLIDRPGDLDALETALEEMLDPERLALEGEKGRRTVRESFGLGTYRERYERAIFGV